ncbi:MAG: LysR family glycine cleavage system transcriptional activator [Paracoccaceae bacterium]|jgi:LysR family glycine cleavage system transcriptional activator
MTDNLPPLTALRAFEAAARHLSFAKAAHELNVTPAALSFQIKSLEAHLGQPVFRRLNRAVELTSIGRTLYPGTAGGFAALSQAWRTARKQTSTTTLTITAGPAITAKWLAPRLFQFAKLHPDIELRFTATLRMMDFDRDEVDVAIRFGSGLDVGVFSKPIIREWLTPMMTPALALKYRTPQDLLEAPLLHHSDLDFVQPAVDWPAWFHAVGLSPPERHGPRFSQSDHAIDAALEGAGIVLGRISLTHKALKDGQLVAPFKTALLPDDHYRFVCPAGSETRPQVNAFLKWIEHESKNAKAFDDQFTMLSAVKTNT